MLDQVVAEAARRFGERPAFVMADGRRSITYHDLDQLAGEVAANLRRRGIGPGDRVALLLPPSVEFPVVHAGLARLGAVAMGVNTRLTPSERSRLLSVGRPTLVVAAAAEHGGTLDHDTAIVDLDSEVILDGLRDVGAGLTADAAGTRDAEDPAVVCFTSGTTGEPKGVVFGARQLAFITSVDVPGGTWGGGGPSLAATSFAHLGPMTKLPGSLMRGGTTHILARWTPAGALEVIEREQIPVAAGISTQVAMMMDHVDFRASRVAHVQMVVMGGGPATPDLVRRVRREFDAPVMIRYSCTEAGIGTGTRADDPPEVAEHTVGLPHPGVEMWIEDADESGVGEVVLGSAAIMSSYLDDPAATRSAMTADGAVRTGDVGRLDAFGRLVLLGRRSERIVRGGYNVESAEVEGVLGEHPGVRHVALVGVPDDTWGEAIIAVVVPEKGRPRMELGDLRAFAAEHLSSFKLPDRLELVGTLPMTAGHKVDKARLRSLLTRDHQLP